MSSFPLPSREMVAALEPLQAPSDLNAILQAYASGRLVDREDREQLIAALGIDYEAAWLELGQVGLNGLKIKARAIVAAALGTSNDASEATE